MSELNPIVRELADLLKQDAVVGENNQVEYKDVEQKFESKLMPIAELVKAQDALLTFSAAGTLATGELGQVHMVSNKDVNRVTSRSQVGRSRVDVSYDRTVSGTAAGKSWTKHGRASADIQLGTGTSTRAYREVVSHLSEEGAKVFSN